VTNSNITSIATPVWSRFVTLNGTTAPTINTLWGAGTLTFDTANSVNYTSWASIPVAHDRVTLTPGQYTVYIRYSITGGSQASGTTWGAITNDANTVTYTSTDLAPGYSTVTVQTPLLIQSTQNVRFTWFSSGTNTGYGLSSVIRIVKFM
jgi:hypothetical protein